MQTLSKNTFLAGFPSHMHMRYGQFFSVHLPDMLVVVAGVGDHLCALGFVHHSGMNFREAVENLQQQFRPFDGSRDWQRDDPWAEQWNLPFPQLSANDIVDLPLLMVGTEFQQAVWRSMMSLGLQDRTTYGALTITLGRPQTHARAVGTAVGRNPISWLVPCHRVLGQDGKLHGYRWGLEIKQSLLRMEDQHSPKGFSRFSR